MSGGTPSARAARALLTAAATVALLAGLMFTALVVEPADQPQISLSAQTETTAPASLTRYAQFHGSTRTDYPVRRRRHHFWNWSHTSGRGGPFSWIVFGPLIAIIITSVALPVFLLRRRTRRPRAMSTPVLVSELPETPAQSYPPPAEVPTDDRLETLSDLHASGALTDEEFETQRRRILGE